MIRLFHVSDVHFGAEDKAALAWFGEAVRRELPDAIIMTGDLTMRATRGEFQRGGDWLRSLGVPVTLAAYVGRERLDVPRPRLMRLGAAALAFALALFLGLDLLADEIAPHDH